MNCALAPCGSAANGDESGAGTDQKNAPTLEKQLNNAVKILQRRQIRIEDPGVRAQVATTLTTVSQYSDLLALFQQDSEISNHLQTRPK